jgi:hypothetical protein
MKRLLLFVFMAVLCAAPLSAGPITYSGVDAAVGPGGARPNSAAAEAAFKTAIAGASGTPGTVDFELATPGYYTNFNVGSIKFTLNGVTNTAGAGVSTDTEDPAVLGYNTTAGGDTFLRVVPIFDIGTVTVDIDFQKPTEYFGAYFTGLGTAAGDLYFDFNNGSPQSLSVPGTSGGGVRYFGVTSFGEPFQVMRLSLLNVFGSRDIYGIDDITGGGVKNGDVTNPVPEPGTLLLTGIGAGIAALKRRRRQ